jgi:hypothetical protein
LKSNSGLFNFLRALREHHTQEEWEMAQDLYNFNEFDWIMLETFLEDKNFRTEVEQLQFEFGQDAATEN